MIHMGFEQDPPCMADGESGVLVAGQSINDVFDVTFMMKDGIAIMCRIEGFNASATKRNTRYSVHQGLRVS